MGHLPIVNQETVKGMIKEGCISTRGDLKKLWVKTISDIFSDVLAVRKGDLVFPWIVKSDKSSNLGFKYIFKVAGAPFFVKGEKYPVRVPLEPEGFEYKNPLSEAEALDLWDRKLLWNVIGKKSLRRGRSLTHQTPMEDGRMIELLEKKNPQGPKKIKLGSCKPTKKIPITINPSRDQWDPKLKQSLQSMTAEERLSNLDLPGIPWRKGNFFIAEKTLEAWMMENIDKSEGKQFRELAFKENWPIVWFANYLPFGVQGSNIDVVILQEQGEKRIANIVELKVGSLNKNDYEEAANQAIDYAIFIRDAFNAFGLSVELNIVVLSGSSQLPLSISRIKRNNLSSRWITYNIDNNGNVRFKRLL